MNTPPQGPTRRPRRRKVLVSGASIAGPALAHWLARHGFEVTVVERAGAPRSGGYPVDIRGTALAVVDRMGLLPRLWDAHVDSRRISFVEADGSPLASIRPEKLTGGVEGRDLEVRRDDLAKALYDASRDDVEFVFGDSIATLHDHEGGVDITFRSGDARTFDLVVGADGIHSHTRGLVLGPEERHHRYLGCCFAGFTMPNTFGLSHEAVLWNTPGRSIAVYAAGDSDQVIVIMTFESPQPPLDVFREPLAQRDLVASAFEGDGWEVPGLVAAMRSADDLFFDVAGQIRTPAWSRGRVALVGDAAHAPSFFSGQGSSLALIGAYTLAGELATRPSHTAAFAAYEGGLREFVERNQGLADAGQRAVTPRTGEELAARNEAMRGASLPSGEEGRAANSALTLPEYAVAP